MPLPLLLLTIAIEGYVVLASELLVIRQLSPYVGNGTDTVAIVIAAVLLPLAFGYHAGGRKHFAAKTLTADLYHTLTHNLLIAGAILVAGLAHLHIGLFFYGLDSMGLTHRLFQTTLYCLLFVAYPTYLLGQTVPLVSNALPKATIAHATGKMLFVSTFGSFMGSIFSTLVLMAFVGVHHTVTLTLGLLFALIVVLDWRQTRHRAFYATLLFAYLATVNSSHIMQELGIVSNTTYSQVRVATAPDGSRDMFINNSSSSRWAATPSARYPYLAYLEDHILPLLSQNTPNNILVIGAGGFTFGVHDTRNTYTYVDIDPTLRHLSEEYLLKEKLGPNKTFVAESGRPFLRHAKQTYDLILIDAYTNEYAMPADLLTQDFYTEIKAVLAPNGMVAVNLIGSPTFTDRFSRSFDATFRNVFPHTSRIPLDFKDPANILYLAFQQNQEGPEAPYTDDKNRYFLDH